MRAIKRLLPVSPQHSQDTLPDQPEGTYVVANSNRWSRISLNFQDLSEDTWCELSFFLLWDVNEESLAVHDFAVIGMSFFTEDGSRIEFPYIPGLARTPLDPLGIHIPGPSYNPQGDNRKRTAPFRFAFLVPSPARSVQVTIRSWRNSQPFKLRNPILRQLLQTDANIPDSEHPHQPTSENSSTTKRPYSAWRKLTPDPLWLSLGLVPGRSVFIRGQLINYSPDGTGILARLIYRNARGERIPVPYPETELAPEIGAFLDIQTHKKARRFTLDLLPPPAAARVEIGFQAWRDDTHIELILPLEVSLDDDLLIESISSDDLLDAQGFLDRVGRQLFSNIGESHSKTPPINLKELLLQDMRSIPSGAIGVLNALRSVQNGPKHANTAEQLTIHPFRPWPIPPRPEWNEDPFQSPAWRLEYQSLAWLLDIAQSSQPDALKRALELASSWSKANPWGHQRDPLSSHPRSLALRSETLLHLISMSAATGTPDNAELETLLAEVVRHGFALSEILGQNVFSHSLYQFQGACALLAIARSIPKFPLSSYWRSCALMHLRDGFQEIPGSDILSYEQSQHYRLEILSLGLILAAYLEEIEEAGGLRSSLLGMIETGFRTSLAITDPSGLLPSFGDTPRGYHYASWIKRLVSQYGKPLLSDPGIVEELEYPLGSRTYVSESEGLIAARHYEQRPDWNYFCSSFRSQRQEHGHFDCTSFVYSAGGVSWISDPGGSSLYEAGPMQQYLVSARAHNIAFPDQREPGAGEGWLKSRTKLDGATVFEIGSNVHGPSYEHRRLFVCLDSLHAVAVFDYFEADKERPLSIESLLHFAPDVTVAVASPRLSIAMHKERQLKIVPYCFIGSFNGLALENGRNDKLSTIQGFAARTSSGQVATNVMRYRFSGHHMVCGGSIMAIDEAALRALQRIVKDPSLKRLFGNDRSMH